MDIRQKLQQLIELQDEISNLNENGYKYLSPEKFIEYNNQMKEKLSCRAKMIDDICNYADYEECPPSIYDIETASGL